MESKEEEMESETQFDSIISKKIMLPVKSELSLKKLPKYI